MAEKAKKQADALAIKAAKSAALATAEERRVYATEGYYENVNGWMKFSHGTRLCTKMLTLKIQIKQLRNKITRIKESMGDSIFESFSNDNKELAEAWKSSLLSRNSAPSSPINYFFYFSKIFSLHFLLKQSLSNFHASLRTFFGSISSKSVRSRLNSRKKKIC